MKSVHTVYFYVFKESNTCICCRANSDCLLTEDIYLAFASNDAIVGVSLSVSCGNTKRTVVLQADDPP